jgi:hypothetical protein
MHAKPGGDFRCREEQKNNNDDHDHLAEFIVGMSVLITSKYESDKHLDYQQYG